MIQQDLFQQIVESGGKETETYYEALNYIRQKCRTEGIDAALQDKKTGENLDALILFDRKGAGQQLAAQAGKDIQRRVPPISSFTCARFLDISVPSSDFLLLLGKEHTPLILTNPIPGCSSSALRHMDILRSSSV